MKDKTLHKNLQPFCVWYKMSRSWLFFQVVFFSGVVVSALAMLSVRLFALNIDEANLLSITGGLVLIVFLLYFLLLSRAIRDVGYLTDRKAGLKNLVSTGLDLEERTDDEVSVVLVRRAEQKLVQQKPARLFPIRLNWAGQWCLAPLAILVGTYFLPEFDLLGYRQEREKVFAEKQAVRKGLTRLESRLTLMDKQIQSSASIESHEITKEFKLMTKELFGKAKEEALLKMGEFESKYKKEFNEHRDFDNMAKSVSLDTSDKDLAAQTRKKLEQLQEQLNDGRLMQVAQTMRDLAKQMQSKNLTQKQKEALAKQMQQLAKQMSQQKGQEGQQQSKDLEKLMRELQSSPEKMDQLCKQCEQTMEQMAQNCEDCENLRQMRDGMKDAKQTMLGESFNDFDEKAMENYLKAQAQLGGSCEGDGQGQGNTGGQGQGSGGRPPENPTDTAFKNRISDGRIKKGRILHQIFVSGVPEKGAARSEYVEVTRAAKDHAAGYLSREKIPREAEEMVKKYFDELELKETAGNTDDQ